MRSSRICLFYKGLQALPFFSYAPAGVQGEWGCWQIDKSQSRLNIPGVQTPTATSPDPKAMAFYGKSPVYEGFEGKLQKPLGEWP